MTSLAVTSCGLFAIVLGCRMTAMTSYDASRDKFPPTFFCLAPRLPAAFAQDVGDSDGMRLRCLAIRDTQAIARNLMHCDTAFACQVLIDPILPNRITGIS